MVGYIKIWSILNFFQFKGFLRLNYCDIMQTSSGRGSYKTTDAYIQTITNRF